ncbi:MAG: AMP-binding protein [Candidatus Woesearchaeota archaeon]
MVRKDNLESIISRHSAIQRIKEETIQHQEENRRELKEESAFKFQYSTIPQVIRESAKKFSDRTALIYKQDETLKSITYAQLDEMVTTFAEALIKYIGLEKGTRVAMILENSPEWLITNLAIQYSGAVDVPRGVNAPSELIRTILEHSGAEVAIIPTLEYIKNLPENGSRLKKVIVIDKDFEGEIGNIISYKDLMRIGVELIKKGSSEVERRISELKGDDLASIIYSSGTTGIPKGAMLTHSNYMHNMALLGKVFGVNEEDRLLTILPIWHAYERQVNYGMLAVGGSIYYGSINTLLSDLKNAEHTVITLVPDILVLLYKATMRKIEQSSPLEKIIAKMLIKGAIEYDRAIRIINDEEPIFSEEEEPDNTKILKSKIKAALLKPIHQLAQKKIYEPLKEKIGKKLRIIISGAGPLPEEIDEFFSAGRPTIPQISEGYGMTETIVVDAVRVPKYYKNMSIGHKIFTVGKVLPGIEYKIVDENEREVGPGSVGRLLLRGPNVMKGYYKNEELTAKAFTQDGYLKTGDLAMKTIDEFIKIIGRADDTIVLRNGEKIEPAVLENELRALPYVDNAVVTYKNDKLRAHIFLNKDFLNVNKGYAHLEEEIKRKIIESKRFHKHETIDEVVFHTEPIAQECLSETKKVKRKKFFEEYERGEKNGV